MDAGKTGELIAALRKEKGWSQAELAERLGVTNKAVSRWETGRGYPDVELLPLVARELGVTISELLEGERTPAPPAVEEQMEYLCESTGREKKKLWAAIAVAAAVSVMLFCMWIYPRVLGLVDQIIGLPECVIGAEYDCLTYYGQRYVPIFLGEVDCTLGEELVSECQVEGSGFWGKLLFGERLWAVKGVSDHEIVYLQTEYDNCLSPYFVLETEKERYEAMAREAEYDCIYAWCKQEDGLGRELRVEIDLDALDRAAAGEEAEDDAWAYPDRYMVVMAYEEAHLFYKLLGELRYKGGACFWFPSRYFEDTGTLTAGLVGYQVDCDPILGP
jgi:transcriptional regulator with XRE-family HTH domain